MELLKTRAVMASSDFGFLRFGILDESGSLKRAKRFVEDVKHQEERNAEKLKLVVEVRVWKKPRSMRQLGLYWMILERIAWVDAVSPELVHEGLKEQYYPRVYYDGFWVPKHPLNSAEQSKMIEHAIAEGAEKGADLSDLWVLWVDGSVKDKQDVEYEDLDEFKAMHPYCDACGIMHPVLEWAHVWPKGSGGPTEPWNLLNLGSEHHVGDQHTVGWEDFLQRFPHLRKKVENALKREGEKK